MREPMIWDWRGRPPPPGAARLAEFQAGGQAEPTELLNRATIHRMQLETAAMERINAVVAKGEKFVSGYVSGQTVVTGLHTQFVPPIRDCGLHAEFEAQARSCLVDLLGESHTYVRHLETAQNNASEDVGVRQQVGVLRAVAEDIGNGHLLRTTRALVAAELFTDFIEQAEHLLGAGYHEAAASLCGAVLESSLPEYATSKGVPGLRPHEDISTLNQKIAQAGLYTVIVRKQVEVWAGVRNQADHGKFGAITKQDVRDMLTGVRKFLQDTLRV